MKSRKLVLTCLSVLAIGLSSCGGTSSTAAGYAAGTDAFSKFLAQDGSFNYTLGENYGQPHMPSTGKSHMLVVPVLFSDTEMEDTGKAGMKEEIRKAFFGEAAETGWQSVKSYYYTSSYGKLDIQGTVSDPVKLPKTFSTYSVMKNLPISTIAATIYKQLFVADGHPYTASDFDSDKDGLVDSIYFVHEGPISTTDNGLGWAFTTWYEPIAGNYPIGTISWSSIKFATRVDGYSVDKPDAHTFIHESGHLLGLNDYYDTYKNSNLIAGGNTMQDCNVCDHDMYSKYLWGWTTPTFVTGKNTEQTISVELKPSEDSGDCLVIAPTDWNGTSLDEYLMIDYYTPTGLNKLDAEKTYESIAGNAGTGIRICHIDKRIYVSHLTEKDEKTTVEFDPNKVTSVKFSSDVDTTNSYVDYYANISTNTSKYYKTDFLERPEFEYLRATYGTDDYSLADATDKKDLFTAGKTFGASTDKFKDFEFYSPSVSLSYDCTQDEYTQAAKYKLPYSIKVDSIGETAKLTLTKLA